MQRFQLVDRGRAGRVPVGFRLALTFGALLGLPALAVALVALPPAEALWLAATLSLKAGVGFAVLLGLFSVLAHTGWGARPMARADLEPRHELVFRTAAGVSAALDTVREVLAGLGVRIVARDEAAGTLSGERDGAGAGLQVEVAARAEDGGCTVRIRIAPALSTILVDTGVGHALRDAIEGALTSSGQEPPAGAAAGEAAAARAPARRGERRRVAERGGPVELALRPVAPG